MESAAILAEEAGTGGAGLTAVAAGSIVSTATTASVVVNAAAAAIGLLAFAGFTIEGERSDAFTFGGAKGIIVRIVEIGMGGVATEAATTNIRTPPYA